MKCPKCKHVIDDKLVGKYLAAKGGAKGKRSDMGAGSEGQRKAQEGRKKAKENKK